MTYDLQHAQRFIFDDSIPVRDQVQVLQYHIKRLKEKNGRDQLGSRGMSRLRGFQAQLDDIKGLPRI